MRRLLNPLAFALRQRLRWRRAGYREAPTGGPPLDDAAAARLESPRAAALVARYPLPTNFAALFPATRLAVLSFLDLLDRLPAMSAPDGVGIDLGPGIDAGLSVLDVGCKNFESAAALWAWLAAAGAAPRLTGIELDAYRVYRSLHSRADAAAHYLGLLPPPPGGSHRYLAADVRAHHDRYDLVFWASPFLDEGPLLAWGLPATRLDPEGTLAHVLGRVEAGGRLLIVNPTDAEGAQQRALLDRAVPADTWEREERRVELGVYLRQPVRIVHRLRRR